MSNPSSDGKEIFNHEGRLMALSKPFVFLNNVFFLAIKEVNINFPITKSS